jgi:phage repressor protein C with HTH and peptisase S24 domain
MIDRDLSTMADPIRSTLVYMETLGERLRLERVGAGLTQQQLADEAGVTKQAVSQIESGATKNPEAATLEPICRRLNLNMRWLQSKIGPKHPATAASSDSFDDVAGYAHGAGMGDGQVAEDFAETHRLKFRAESLRSKGLDAKRLKVYYGQGDSMEPTIEHDDAIMFDTGDAIPRDDSIFVIESIEDGTIAKRLRNYGGRWFVVSDNKSDPKWRDPIPLDDKRRGFHIVGRVRWIARWKD